MSTKPLQISTPSVVVEVSLKRIKPDIGGISLSLENHELTKKQRTTSTTTTITRPNIRPRLIASTSMKITHPLTKLSTVVVSPFSFLQSIVKSDSTSFKCYDSFSKPTDKELAAYDIQVVSAIRNCNLQKLKELHQGGKTMNACNQFGESLMHMACRRGDVNIVKFMLSCKDVKVNVRDDYGRTPMHDACWTSTPNFEVMELLLEAVGPELLFVKDVRGHSPFCYARREHWGEWVAFLTKNKEILGLNTDSPKQVLG